MDLGPIQIITMTMACERPILTLKSTKWPSLLADKVQTCFSLQIFLSSWCLPLLFSYRTCRGFKSILKACFLLFKALASLPFSRVVASMLWTIICFSHNACQCECSYTGRCLKHRKNCESCQSQVTWKVKFKCQFVPSCPVLLGHITCSNLDQI